MIVALERNAFINFFKSGFLKIAVERRINFSLDKLVKLDTDIQYNLLDPIIPEFEEEQEIIFIEFKKSAINSLVLQFEDILKIFNSTEQADFFNTGKFNTILNIDQPYFSNVFERIKLNRNYKGKQVVNELLKRVFSVSGDSRFEDFIYKSLFTDKQSNFIKSLIAYNVTPGILPQGNLEFILKVGLAIFDWKGTSVDKFEKGDYYKNLITNVNAFKNRSLCADLETFYSLLKSNHELENAYNIIVNLLSEFDSSFDLYKIAYFYLGFKFMILKADNDISNDFVLYNLAELKITEPEIFVQAIHLLSRTFSFNDLYEGIYKLIEIPVLSKKESCVGMLSSFYSKINNELNAKCKESREPVTITSKDLKEGNYSSDSDNLSNENSYVNYRLISRIEGGRETKRKEDWKGKYSPVLENWKAREENEIAKPTSNNIDSASEKFNNISSERNLFEENIEKGGLPIDFVSVGKKEDSKAEVIKSISKARELRKVDDPVNEKSDLKEEVADIENIDEGQIDAAKVESKKKEVKSSGSSVVSNRNKNQDVDNQSSLMFAESKGNLAKGQRRKRTK